MQLKTEVNTNAKPNVRNSDVHLDITGDLMTFISIEHASNYKKMVCILLAAILGIGVYSLFRV